jgi:hypothetical protein
VPQELEREDLRGRAGRARLSCRADLPRRECGRRRCGKLCCIRPKLVGEVGRLHRRRVGRQQRMSACWRQKILRRARAESGAGSARPSGREGREERRERWVWVCVCVGAWQMGGRDGSKVSSGKRRHVSLYSKLASMCERHQETGQLAQPQHILDDGHEVSVAVSTSSLHAKQEQSQGNCQNALQAQKETLNRFFLERFRNTPGELVALVFVKW